MPPFLRLRRPAAPTPPCMFGRFPRRFPAVSVVTRPMFRRNFCSDRTSKPEDEFLQEHMKASQEAFSLSMEGPDGEVEDWSMDDLDSFFAEHSTEYQQIAEKVKNGEISMPKTPNEAVEHAFAFAQQEYGEDVLEGASSIRLNNSPDKDASEDGHYQQHEYRDSAVASTQTDTQDFEFEDEVYMDVEAGGCQPTSLGDQESPMEREVEEESEFEAGYDETIPGEIRLMDDPDALEKHMEALHEERRTAYSRGDKRGSRILDPFEAAQIWKDELGENTPVPTPQGRAEGHATIDSVELHESDLVESFVRGSGPGGQKVNKTSNCVTLKHVPTGTVVKCHSSRSQLQNRKLARKRMKALLEELVLGYNSRRVRQQQLQRKRKSSKRRKSLKKKEAMAAEGKVSSQSVRKQKQAEKLAVNTYSDLISKS